ncbi:MAG TPA: hypothetical protein VMB25_06840 [Bryobacteraceae bacterium]|nr:hypothetical protein [Bryobacteraceae bacterium]
MIDRCQSPSTVQLGAGAPEKANLSMSSGITLGMLVWMPSNSGGACTPISSVMIAPQSPP